MELRGCEINAVDVPLDVAQQMAAVGIVPSKEGPNEEPVGHQFMMAGQVFSVIGYATREEFLERALEVLTPGEAAVLALCPNGYYFQRISTD